MGIRETNEKWGNEMKKSISDKVVRIVTFVGSLGYWKETVFPYIYNYLADMNEGKFSVLMIVLLVTFVISGKYKLFQ